MSIVHLQRHVRRNTLSETVQGTPSLLMLLAHLSKHAKEAEIGQTGHDALLGLELKDV